MARPGAVAIETELDKQINLLATNKDVRDAIERGNLTVIKGKEHLLLYVLAKLLATEGEHSDTINEYLFSNMNERLQKVEKLFTDLIDFDKANIDELKDMLTRQDIKIGQNIEKIIEGKMDGIDEKIVNSVREQLQNTVSSAQPSIENNESIKKMVEDVADSYNVITQMRLLLNETHRRISEIAASEATQDEAFKLVVREMIEEGLTPLKERVSIIDARTDALEKSITKEVADLKEAMAILTKSVNRHLDNIEHAMILKSDKKVSNETKSS